jgi:hypothetical protein
VDVVRADLTGWYVISLYHYDFSNTLSCPVSSMKKKFEKEAMENEA